MITEERSLCMGCMSQLGPDGRCTCGYDPAVPTDPACLTPGVVLAERYLVGRATAMNGEGITYIGFDRLVDERVFVREFMPQAICHRNEFTGVVMPFPGLEAQYKTLLSDFYDLGVSLKNNRMGDNIVPVTEVFTERATVYAVYKFVKTISYGEYLLHNGGEFTWAQVKKLFMPLFTTLSNLHSYGFIHRGISPDTIRVNARGQLLLCGFGISAVRTDQSGIEPELFPGYTAPEQYSLSSWQGSWTDVYAIAAVLYKSLTGTMPSDAPSRRDIDRLCPPEQLSPYIPQNVAHAIGHAMEVQVELRTQTIDQLTAELLTSAEGNTTIYTSPSKDEGAGLSSLLGDDELFPETLPEHGRVSRRPAEKSRRQTDTPKKRPVALIAWLLSMLVLTTVLILVLRQFQNGLGPGGNETGSATEAESGSAESGTIKVPNFIGRMRTNVEGNEEYADFTLVFDEQFNDDYSKGMIYDQSISAKAEVEPGMTITLFVSKGAETVPMPNVVGMTVEEAEAALKELEIKYQLLPKSDSSYTYNVIASQTVDEGAEVPVGGTRVQVYLVYGSKQAGTSSGDVIIIDGSGSSTEGFDYDYAYGAGGRN